MNGEEQRDDEDGVTEGEEGGTAGSGGHRWTDRQRRVGFRGGRKESQSRECDAEGEGKVNM